MIRFYSNILRGLLSLLEIIFLFHCSLILHPPKKFIGPRECCNIMLIMNYSKMLSTNRVLASKKNIRGVFFTFIYQPLDAHKNVTSNNLLCAKLVPNCMSVMIVEIHSVYDCIVGQYLEFNRNVLFDNIYLPIILAVKNNYNFYLGYSM